MAASTASSIKLKLTNGMGATGRECGASAPGAGLLRRYIYSIGVLGEAVRQSTGTCTKLPISVPAGKVFYLRTSADAYLFMQTSLV
jgi:hypothetical protein